MNCPNCQTPNANTSRFCRGCGAALVSTSGTGRTVAMPGPSRATVLAPSIAAPVQLSPAEVQNAAERAQQAYGSGPVSVRPLQASQTMPGQREDVALVNDRSTSMGGRYDGRLIKLDAAKRAAVTMVVNKAQIDPNDAIGVVIFDTRAQVVMPVRPLATYKPQIIQAIQSIQVGGGTDINEGLKAARGLFDWTDSAVVRRIVLLTDGQGGNPLRTAEDLKDRGVVIDVIGIGASPRGVDEKLLKKVASVIGGETHYWFIKDQQTLVRTYTYLANKTATK